MRDFATFILRSHLHAIGVAGFFGMVSLHVLPFAILSTAALALMVLRHGAWHGGVVMLGAGLPVMAAWLGSELKPGLDYPLVFALWVPVFFAAIGMRRGLGQGVTLMMLTVYCLLCVLLMHLITGDVVAFWLNWLGRAIAAVPGARIQGFERDGTLRLMNGLLAVLYLSGLVFSLWTGRWLQSLLHGSDGFGQEFRALHIPRWFMVVSVIAVGVARYWLYPLMLDWLMLLGASYTVAGLALLHALVARHRLNPHWLLPPYMALLILPQQIIPGLALMGVIDSLVDVRRRTG